MHFQGRLSVIIEEYLLWTNKNKDYTSVHMKFCYIFLLLWYTVRQGPDYYHPSQFSVKHKKLLLTHVAPSSNRDFLVTPGRMAPVKGGVAISGSREKKKLKNWRIQILCSKMHIQEVLNLKLIIVRRDLKVASVVHSWMLCSQVLWTFIP